jgi:heat shock protein HtpX
MDDGSLQLVHSSTVETELPSSLLHTFPKFIREQMAFGQLPGIKMSDLESFASHQGHYLQFNSGPERGTYQAQVRIYFERPMRVEVRSTMGPNEEFTKHLDDVLLFAIQFFEEHARQSMVNLVFLPGRKETAELRKSRSVARSIFTGNMLGIFLISIFIGIFIIGIFNAFGLGQYAPFAFLAVMLGIVLSAGRITAWRSTWRITKEVPDVVLVQYTVPQGDLDGYLTDPRTKQIVTAAKRKAYELFSSCPDDLCSEKIADVFREAGMNADPKDFLVRRINVYGLVERVAKRFGISVPAIVLLQDPRPNAAATGFTRNFGTMMITIGLLVQLDESEVELVVGHELSHLRFGDPMVLFSLITVEYLLRVYVYFDYVASSLLIFIPYIVGILWGIFFVGKFLESRADLEAGIILGKPKVMAESLKKIGFRRLVFEERFLEPNVSRFGEWLRIDPHPPLYFRIQRLEALDLNNPPKHPFLSSIRAVASGFVHSGRAP